MSRRRVRCPACAWEGQRREATALELPCPRPGCGAAVELGADGPGRPSDGGMLRDRFVAWLREQGRADYAQLAEQITGVVVFAGRGYGKSARLELYRDAAVRFESDGTPAEPRDPGEG